MTAAIPRHFSEQDAHRAEISETVEGEAKAYESREEKPDLANSEGKGRASQDQKARAQTDLALQRPTSLNTRDHGESRLNPRIGSPLKHG